VFPISYGMIRIGIEAHNLEGHRVGVGRYLENLLMEWGSSPEVAEKVQFILYFKKEIPKDSFLANPVFICRQPNWLSRKSFLLYFLLALPFWAWRDKADIVFFPGYMIPWTYRGGAVLVSHDISFERFPHLFSLRYRLPYQFFGRYGAHMAKAVIAVSRFSKQEIVELYHLPPEKVYVVPNGRDKRFVRKNQQEIQRAKTAAGIVGDYIFYYGQIFNRRHVAELLRAYEKIAPSFPTLQLLVVGGNHTQKPYIDIDGLAEGINHRLSREAVIRKEFIESNEDIIALCSGARAGAYLSSYEGFGLPPLEFLACGTPVLAPNTTALADTLEGKQVVIQDPTDIDEIALALRRTLTDPEITSRARADGPVQAAKFSWTKCAQDTLDILTTASRI